MGNNTSNPGVLHGEAKLAASKFDPDEIVVLQKTWEDLADRNNGKGIDKETFLQYFPLNGLLGERLFAQFDTKGHGLIDFDEFITGLAIACRGTQDEKIHFIFNMYNVSHDKKISKQELTTLLNHIPKEVLHQPDMIQSRSHNNLSSLHSAHDGNDSDSSTSNTEGEIDMRDTEEELDSYTNNDLVEKAFQECDIYQEGRLSYEEFKMWVQRTPAVMDHIESILPYNGPKDLQPHHSKKETLPHMKRASARLSLSYRTSLSGFDPLEPGLLTPTNNGSTKARSNSTFAAIASTLGGRSRNVSNVSDVAMPGLSRDSSLQGQSPGIQRSGSFSLDHASCGQVDADEVARMYLIQALDAAANENLRAKISSLIESLPSSHLQIDSYHNLHANDFNSGMGSMRSPISIESYLWKRGKFLHVLSKRYYLLSGNCIYYYSYESDLRPKGVIFLTGSIVDRVKDEDMELKGYYGFELLHQDLCTGEHHRHEKRVLYCKSEDERERWVVSLQHAAQVIPIEDDYVIGKEIGRGRFSVVCECVHKVTGKHCAVKIIDKKTIEPDEKQLLRTEIAVLKLVHHPNIICLEGIYESRTSIYIVMEMLKGGELFQRIVGRPRFSEVEAAKVIRPLLESVAYIHDLGIVHRDIKPENILCGSELEDLKIADFGLSKMVLPKEKMDNACGTLSYVAPEVLTMQGYGKEADLWSVGVIMFLLMCGKLPFDGDDHNEIIRNTIHGELKVNAAIWGKLSEEAKSLMMALLNKSPKDRISARDAIKHPFITKFAPRKHAHGNNSIHHAVPSGALSKAAVGSLTDSGEKGLGGASTLRLANVDSSTASSPHDSDNESCNSQT